MSDKLKAGNYSWSRGPYWLRNFSYPQCVSRLSVEQSVEQCPQRQLRCFYLLAPKLQAPSLHSNLLMHHPRDWALNANSQDLCLFFADSTGHSERRHTVNIKLIGKLHRRCVPFPELQLPLIAPSTLSRMFCEFSQPSND